MKKAIYTYAMECRDYTNHYGEDHPPCPKCESENIEWHKDWCECRECGYYDERDYDDEDLERRRR